MTTTDKRSAAAHTSPPTPKKASVVGRLVTRYSVCSTRLQALPSCTFLPIADRTRNGEFDISPEGKTPRALLARRTSHYLACKCVSSIFTSVKREVFKSQLFIYFFPPPVLCLKQRSFLRPSRVCSLFAPATTCCRLIHQHRAGAAAAVVASSVKMSHFVRASKYRHVYVESPKVSEQIGAST